MKELTEHQFRRLCDLYRMYLDDEAGVPSNYVIWFSEELFKPLEDEGLVTRKDMNHFKQWELELTEKGKELVEGRGRELSKPDFGDLTSAEKKIIAARDLFRDGARLLFDRDEEVAVEAVLGIDFTEEEFIRLGDSPFPAVREHALRRGQKCLEDPADLDRNLYHYLRHGDKRTVKAVLETLRAAQNIEFVDEGLINRWFETDIPDQDMLQMLDDNGVEVPDSTIANLLAGRDPEVLEALSELVPNRLDSAQVDMILAEGNEDARAEIADCRLNLTASQVEKLEQDESSFVRGKIERRLERLACQLQAVEDDPGYVSAIRAGNFK